MRKLTDLDAACLVLDGPNTCGHVSEVSILAADPATGLPLSLAVLTDYMGQRLHLAPPLRRRLMTGPLSMGQYWVDDPDFDLTFHIRELALPRPGSMAQLTEQIARLHARPLDRKRPLWEMYLITGLAKRKVAVYIKVHHALMDASGARELTSVLFDPTTEARTFEAEEWQADRLPGAAELTARSALWLADSGPRTLKAAKSAALTVSGLAARDGGLADRWEGLRQQKGVFAPPTPFNTNVSPHRRLAFRTTPLSTIRRVKDRAGVKVNDVLVAMAAGALRRWLEDHDALPDRPLIAGIPTSIRAPLPPDNTDPDRAFGNAISYMFPPIPTDLVDPAERLMVTHENIDRAKRMHRVTPTSAMGDWGALLPPEVVSAMSRVTARARLTLFNLTIANAMGPSEPEYLLGHRVTACYPASIVAEGLGLNISALTYLDQVYWGLVADRDLVPDVEDLADHVVAELKAIDAALK